MTTSRDINTAKIRLAALAVVFACLCSYFGQPLIHNNEQALNVIVTVFSVLAGFLVAIIAVVGDPALLPPGSWRAAEQERDKLNDRLVRHKWLFLLYLITLALIFISLLFKSAAQCESLVLWVERTYLFFGSLSFTLSLTLPSSLMKVQRERIDAVIEHRRSQDNIPK